MGTDRDRLRGLLQAHSLFRGRFQLSSGRTSSYYVDSKKTTLRADGAYLTAREVLRVLRENGIRVRGVGGMTLGADPIVCAVAAVSHLEGTPLDAFIVRKEVKEHGTARAVETTLPEGAPVVVVDDVVTTAGSTLRAIEAAEAAGLRVVCVLCLVDREQGGTAKLSRWPFLRLFTAAELLDVPGGAGAPGDSANQP